MGNWGEGGTTRLCEVVLESVRANGSALSVSSFLLGSQTATFLILNFHSAKIIKLLFTHVIYLTNQRPLR